MMRREFVAGLVGSAATWPIAARAQQPRRVGGLIPSYPHADPEGQASIAAFLEPLQRSGWIDCRNVTIESRWGAGDAERTKTAAADLGRSASEVIVVATSPAVAELRRLTKPIPIVFLQVGDPVDSGFV